MSLHRLVMAVACAGAIASAPAAHGAPQARLAIDGVDVEQVAGLAAGVPLRFTVYGTPGAAAALHIDGGWHLLALRETDPGVYEGTYLIDSRDAIGAASRVTATLQQGGQVARADLDEPLLLAEAPLPWAEAAARAAPPAAPMPSPVPAQVPSSVPLVVPSAAPMPWPTPATAVARAPASVQGANVAATPVPAATAARPVPLTASPVVVARAPERPSCDDCAFVESVREVHTPPGAIGAIAGAIAGAVLGDELGEAHTRHMMRVLGAIGGAIAGREVERQATLRTRYDVVLRMADGRREVRRYDRAPPFAPGATVRVGAVRGESAPSPF